MNIDTDNEKRIAAYIRSHPECKTRNVENVSIHDERVTLEVYRLPTNLIFFNIKNGRFAAEYRELKEKEGGRELDSKDSADSRKIQKLLLDLDEKQTKVLTEDIRRLGQKEPGIITHDGFLINGNRRMAVLNELKKEDDKYGYLLVAILPKNIDHKDLWKIEANIQLSRNEKLDYGPINTLLKLKEGKEAGMTEAQIVRTLYGGFTEAEIREKLDRLTLMEHYLAYIKIPGQYKKLEHLDAHFVELQNTIEKEKRLGTPAKELLTVQKIGFELIFKNTKHMDVRKLGSVMRLEAAKRRLLESEKFLIKDFSKEHTNEPVQNEDDERLVNDLRNNSKIKTVFFDTLDIVKASNDENKPAILLGRALVNLEAINLDSIKDKMSSDREVAKNVRKVLEFLDKFKKRVS